MLKLKYLTAATLLAIAGQAGAATVGITDGSPSDPAVEGNGEFILTAWDEVTKLSYTRQLEMFVEDFVPSEKVGVAGASGVGAGTFDATPETGLTKFFAGDALFVSTFSTSNPADIKWRVTAGDNRLLPPETQSSPDGNVLLATSPSTTLSNVATVSGLTNALISLDDVILQINSTGCGTGIGTSCVTTEADNPNAFGSYLDTTQYGGIGATIVGLNSTAYFQYITPKSGTPGLTKPTRILYDNSAGAGTWTLGANGDLTWNIASATVVPVPAAVWLFGSGLLGLVGVARRKLSA